MNVTTKMTPVAMIHRFRHLWSGYPRKIVRPEYPSVEYDDGPLSEPKYRCKQVQAYVYVLLLANPEEEYTLRVIIISCKVNVIKLPHDWFAKR